MNVTIEIETLKTVVEALTGLEPEARSRVIAYACEALEIKNTRKPDWPAAQDRQSPGSAPRTGKPSSPQEYLRRYTFKTMTKRIGVVAVFLERERGKQRFSLKDVTEAFRDAKEPKTPAHSQYFRAVAMNYLAKDGDQFYATNQAEALVDSYASAQNGDGGKDEE